MQNLNPRPSFKIENEQAINSEKALLIVLSIISQITKIISNIEWPNIKSFGDWVSRLAGQRQCPNIFILNYFDHLNISNCVLDIKDFYNTNLEYSILTKSSLLYINLMEADLRGAHLAGADLEGADLKNVSGLKSNK